MKRLLVITAIAGGLAICVSATHKTLSNAAPAGSSGAPGELTCAKSGCHDDAMPNTGSGIISLRAKDGLLRYRPSQKLSFTLKISQGQLERFGFQVLALQGNGNSAGEWIVTDANRTQAIDGYGTYNGRSYMTYTYDGTSTPNPGSNEWSFDWTAPAIADKPVTLYFAAVAANNDGTDKGDLVYTDSLVLQPDNTAGTGTAPSGTGLKLYPNPASGTFSVELEEMIPAKGFRLSLSTADGKTLPPPNSYASGRKLVVCPDAQLPSGMYLLHIDMDDRSYSQWINYQP